jgi:hypothetical protein
MKMDEDDDNPFNGLGELDEDGQDMEQIERDLAARYGMSMSSSTFQANENDKAGVSKLLDLSDSDDSEDKGYQKMK